MATFQVQVEGLTSLSIGTTPTAAELSEFLKDGVIDVTNRWLAMKPQDIEDFVRGSSTQSSNGFAISGANIVSVIREAGADGDIDGSTAWEPCRKVPSSMRSRVVDVDSLSYASKYNPVYIINNNSAVNVYPVPDGTNDGYRVYYVNNEPKGDGIVDELAAGHSTIGYFPKDKVYLVVMYAGMRSLHAAMGATTITDLTVTVVPPDVPLLASTSLSFSQAAPTYTKPTVSLTAAPTIGNLTISVSAPTTISAPDISGVSVGAVTIDALPSAPDYTAPVFTSASTYLTEMEAGVIGHADSDIDIEHWFSIAGQIIEDEEDVELAQAHLQKISTFLQAFQADMQNQLNIFNEGNAVYQATVQRNLQQAQINMQDAQKEADIDLQEKIQDYTLTLQKFQADIQNYQAVVNDEVQEYQQNLAGDLQVWQAERTTDLQKYTTDIQNELNEFNKENAAYQAQLQVSIQNAQLENQDEQFKVQKYQAEYAGYAAEVTEQVQAYTQNLQADGVGYQWLQDQYNRLKAEYDAAFMIAAPKQQQAAPAR